MRPLADFPKRARRAMTRILLDECFGFDLDADREAVVFSKYALASTRQSF